VIASNSGVRESAWKLFDRVTAGYEKSGLVRELWAGIALRHDLAVTVVDVAPVAARLRVTDHAAARTRGLRRPGRGSWPPRDRMLRRGRLPSLRRRS